MKLMHKWKNLQLLKQQIELQIIDHILKNEATVLPPDG